MVADISERYFVELDENDLQSVDGGIAWALIGLAVLCAGGFGIGVYNGYKGNS